MKTFTKKSMALLLAVLMMLSCVVTGTFAFTASAEEATGEDVAYEAAIFYGDAPYVIDGVAQTGTFEDMIDIAKEKSDAYLTIKLYKDVELTKAHSIKSKTIAEIDGQGHTIYVGKTLLESLRNTGTNTNYIFNFWVYAKKTFPITFKNLTLSGQPMDWDGTAATATYMGKEDTNEHGGAIVMSKYAKFTLENCRIENFYTYTKASCISMDGPNATTDREDAVGQRGIWLVNTTLTNNYNLNGQDAGGNAAAIRGRSDQIGTEIHVSGDTYVDNNYTNGLPTANIYTTGGNIKPTISTKTSTDKETGETVYTLSKNYWDNQDGSITVYVEEDFTGSVAITKTGDISYTTYYQPTNIVFNEETNTYEVVNAEWNATTYRWEGTDVETVVRRGTVVFNGNYDPTDGGFIYAWAGTANPGDRRLIVPNAESEFEGEAMLVGYSANTATNVWLYMNGEWSNSTDVKATLTSTIITTATEYAGATDTESKIAAAKNTLVVLTGNEDLAYGVVKKGMYQVFGNGHVLTSKWDSSWGGLPMFRFDNANTTVLFHDIILDGDIKTTVGTDGYLEFDKISTSDVEVGAIGAGSGNGGALESNAAGQYISLENVEIRNFVQNRCNWAAGDDKRFGSAIYDSKGSEWHLNNVSIHDNYTGESSVPVHLYAATRVYLSGDIEMYNNYRTKYATGYTTSTDVDAVAERQTAVQDNFTIVAAYDILMNSPDTLILDGTAKSDSIIMQNYCSDAAVVARIPEGAELGVNFVNSVEPTWVPYVVEGATDGYRKVMWLDPTNVPETVNFVIYGIDNEKVVIDDYTAQLKGGATLPSLNGNLTWYNSEGTAVTTHTKGVTTYYGKWSEDATQVVMYSTDNRLSWSAGSDLEVITWSTTLATDIELLCNYEQSSSCSISYKAIFVFDGNGYTISVPEGSSLTNLYYANANETLQTTKTFKNITFDGDGWTTIGSGTAMIAHGNNSGTLVFDGCTFKNIHGTGDAGVFRPTGITTLKLKDCTFTNCSGTKGTVRTGFNTTHDISPLIVLEGNTTMTGGANRIYLNGCGVLAVSGDFTGTVDVYGAAMSSVEALAWTAIDRVVAYPGLEDKATVAEGATITGKIWNKNDTTGATFAYDNNGVLCWGNADSLAKFACTFDLNGGDEVIVDGKYEDGEELPAPVKADFSGETPKFFGADWYYDNAGVPTVTTKILEGVTSYYVGEWDEDKSVVEAYVDEDNYGSLIDVLANDADGDRIELLRDVALSTQASINKSITLDGNGKTIAFALDKDNVAIIRGNLVGISAGIKVLITDVVFDGGATEAGVWGHAIQKENTGFIGTGANSDKSDESLGVEYHSCTFKGLRAYSTSESTSAIYVNGIRTAFTGDTVITDNMYRAVQYDRTSGSYVFGTNEDGSYIDATNKNCRDTKGNVVAIPDNKIGCAIRCDNGSIVYIKDNAQIYGNYGIYVTVDTEAGTPVDTYLDKFNFTTGGSDSNPGHKRVVFGPLADSAHIVISAPHGFMVDLDENGVPYVLGNQISDYDTGNSYAYIASAHNPNAEDVAADRAWHTAIDGSVLPICRLYSNIQFVGGDGGSQVGGNLASDKLTLDVYLTLRARQTATLEVTVGGVEISKKTLAEYGTPITRGLSTSNTYGWHKVTVELGMAQLTDTLRFALYDEEGNLVGSFNTTAKSYLDTLITGNVAPDALKDALAALLEYGTMAQIQFNYNTDKLANDGDYSARTYKKVTANALTFTDPTQVKATKSGSLAGVTLLGSSLVLDNQVSMRIYVNVDDASKYTFTVDGDACELITGKNGTYIEIANIGTAALGEFVTLAITPVAGGEGITYTVSPMSYVYAVNGSASQPVNLKNVCEGMFYYYDAVMTAFELEQDITYTTEEVMTTATDTPNNYSVPSGIEE